MLGLEATSINMDHGFVEAMLRSLRKNILEDNAYQQLKQTSNIQEFRMQLEDSGNFQGIFDNQNKENSAGEFEVGLLRQALKEKLHTELMHLESQAVFPLNEFIQRMLHGYQIDNVVSIIEGLKNGRSYEEMMSTADPLGMFKELQNIKIVEGDTDYANLYTNVLIDLPVGVYFRKFLNEIAESVKAADDNAEFDSKYISQLLKNESLQNLQLRVRKIWLNEFYDFCEVHLPETSREVMVDYLKFEADCQTIQIINNSFVVGGMNNPAVNETERRKFMPRIGYLYPDRQDKLSNVTDMRTLLLALDGSPYEKLLARVSSGDDRNEAESANVTIDDVMLEEASRRYSIGFEGGFHVGCFFSFMKLRE